MKASSQAGQLEEDFLEAARLAALTVGGHQGVDLVVRNEPASIDDNDSLAGCHDLLENVGGQQDSVAE